MKYPKYLENAWALTGLIFLFSLILVILLAILLPINFNLSSLVMTVIGSMLVGRYYTSKTKKVMKDDLRKKVAIRYVVVQLVASLILFYFMSGLILGLLTSALWGSLLIILLIVFMVIDYFLVKFGLRIGGESYRKRSHGKK
jgi:fatty-acid desaturase